ncbi:hypothetical protein ACFSYG_11960 [Leeuwenhoekiella polynyae]|nr:hypothetical protein [Leeuwenhoekiella polynyae]
MADKTYKFQIEKSIYKKNFTAPSYRQALIEAKKWRDELRPGHELKPVS